MSLTVHHHQPTHMSGRLMGTHLQSLGRSQERLSSGMKINRSGDDASGLVISEGWRSSIRGAQKALNNAQDGLNVLNIADGALGEMTNVLQDMRELAVQIANDTVTDAQRAQIDSSHFNQMIAELDRVSASANFNGINLLDGSRNGVGNFVLQIGSESSPSANTLDLGAAGVFAAVDTATLGVDNASVGIDTRANALAAITAIDAALTQVVGQRTTLGGMQVRLEGVTDNLLNAIELQSQSESRIRDTDVAAEGAELVRSQLLQQSSATLFAQSNQSRSVALSLLAG